METPPKPSSAAWEKAICAAIYKCSVLEVLAWARHDFQWKFGHPPSAGYVTARAKLAITLELHRKYGVHRALTWPCILDGFPWMEGQFLLNESTIPKGMLRSPALEEWSYIYLFNKEHNTAYII